MADSRLLPEARNGAFVAVQAAMLAITKGDPVATRRCLEIALSELKVWRWLGPFEGVADGPCDLPE